MSNFVFQLNPNPAMIVYGAVYCLLAAGTLPFYLLMFSVGRKEKSNWSFKLMNVINVLEATQAIGHFVTSPLLVFPALLETLHLVVGIIGPLMNCCWLAVMPTMATLAVCRVLLFGNVIKVGETPLLIKLAFYLSMIWCTLLFVYGSANRNFILFPPLWDYDYETPYAQLLSSLELPVSFLSLGIAFFSYLTITYLIYQRRKMTSGSGSRATEIAILLQYTFITLYITILIFFFHSANLWMDMSNSRNLAIMNSAWICTGYVNPVSLLIVNKSFRNDCKRFFGLQKTRSALISVANSKIGATEVTKTLT